LRLAVVTPFIDRQHGTERALAELLERLSREYCCEIHLYAERVQDLEVTQSGHPQQPVILSRPQDGEGPQPSAHRPTRQRNSIDPTNAAGVSSAGSIRWHPVRSIPGPHLFKFLFWLLANTTIRWWHRIARGLRFDLVLSPGINCLDADFIIVHAVFRRLRELAREQPQQPFVPETRSSTPRRLHRSAYYATVAAFERIVYRNRKKKLAAVSQRTAELLALSFGRKDVRVIFNGIDTLQFSVPARLARRQGARYRRKLSDDELVLLLIGNDWRMKGLPAVLESLAAASDLPLRLIVAGSDFPAHFQGIVEHLKVGKRCLWESTRPDVIDFYAAADIYVSPTREDSFGLPVAEAMACGLPVITSRFAGVSERIQNERDGFILSNPMDVPALTSLLRRLHADASLRESIGEAAAAVAQNWTWDRNAAEIWAWLRSAKPTR
jgi:glycosyltransferase involved in cell wall biosynthesis